MVDFLLSYLFSEVFGPFFYSGLNFSEKRLIKRVVWHGIGSDASEPSGGRWIGCSLHTCCHLTSPKEDVCPLVFFRPFLPVERPANVPPLFKRDVCCKCRNLLFVKLVIFLRIRSHSKSPWSFPLGKMFFLETDLSNSQEMWLVVLKGLFFLPLGNYIIPFDSRFFLCQTLVKVKIMNWNISWGWPWWHLGLPRCKQLKDQRINYSWWKKSCTSWYIVYRFIPLFTGF